jgi:hypothetical protein
LSVHSCRGDGRGSGELALPLRGLMLSVGLPSMGLCSLPLLMRKPYSEGRPISDYSTAICGGTVIMARVAGAFSICGVVVMGANEALVLRVLREGKPEPPSPLDVMWNSSAEYSIMARRGDGVPL